MPSQRYDVLAPTGRRKPDGKDYMVRIGTMFENRAGFSLILDALPITTLDQDGRPRVTLVAFPADTERQAQSSQRTRQSQPASHAQTWPSAELGDDEVPF